MPAESNVEKIPIGISSCLLGEKVRYDGGHKYNSYIVTTLGNRFEYRSFCPEMTIGLGVPRNTIRLIDVDNQTRCVGTNDSDFDVTDRLKTCATEQTPWISTIYGYIFKKGSPSCGIEKVKIYRNEQLERNGIGIYARAIMDHFPTLPIEDEERLNDPLIRENFIEKVIMYKRWREQQ